MTPLAAPAVLGVAVGAGVLGAAAGVAVRRAIARVPGARAPSAVTVVGATALSFAVVGGAVAQAAGRAAAGWPATPVAAVLVGAAYLWLAAASIALAVIDLQTRRLPDRLVLPGYATGALLLGLAAVSSGDAAAALRAGVGAALLFGFYLALRLASPRGMGGGDVKLAGVLGLHLGWAGWASLGVGAAAAFLLGGVASLVVLAARRGARGGGRGGRAGGGIRVTTIAFGPWMLAGAWLGLGWGDAVAALLTGAPAGR